MLPIGGVKEKVLAAKRAGIKLVILPERNRKDLVDITRDQLKGLKFQFVSQVEDGLRIALERTAAGGAKRKKTTHKVKSLR